MDPNIFTMEQTPKRKKVESGLDSAQQEVLGISRSGRIRKKSSKLMDFESPDDIEAKLKRPPAPKFYPPPMKAHLIPPPNQMIQQYHQPTEMAIAHQPDVESGSDSDYYDNSQDNEERMESDSSEAWSDNERPQHTPSSSLYMMEKSQKRKLVVKDGRVVGKAKAQRKDKGKSRITAYMMWAKGAREEILRSCPDMDFSTVSKRLGELWSNVNFQERYVWKRKAKRYAMEMDKQEHQSYTKIISNAAPVKPSNPVGRPPKNPRPTPLASSTPTSTLAQNIQQVSSVNGCGPVQVAAHLRLLGESLAIIGERLKEHEGQIAVSGSVSVLLDTVLCSLAPLLCITRAIPAIAPPQEILKDTLNNIAYIMPGL